jgi:X8 domain
MRKQIDSYGNFSEDIKVSSILPGKISDRLCACMMSTLGCIANDETDDSNKLLARRAICNRYAMECSGIKADYENGIWGSFVMCNGTERTSWAFNLQYLRSRNDSSACNSLGGILQNPKPQDSLPNDCKVLLRQAGPEGSGTVTFFPTATSDSRSEFVESSRELNRGSKIAIGVSIGSVALLVITLLLYFRNRRRKRMRLPEPKGNEYQTPELPSDKMAAEKTVVTLLDSTQIIELEAPQPSELEDKGINELEALEMLELEALEMPSKS